MIKSHWLAALGGALFLFTAGTARADVMSVSGTKLLLNGENFQMNGVEIDAFVAPSDWYGAAEGNYPGLTSALNAYNTTELQYVQAYGANTIDFQVGEMGLDPANTAPSTAARVAFSASYVQQLVSAVELARGMGFIVMISVADSKFDGDANFLGLPTTTTLAADVMLANLFQGDTGIIFELMTEPYPAHDTTLVAHVPQWNADNIYINGGSDDLGNIYVGVNTIIQQMRAAGSQNLIVVETPSQYFTAYENAGTYPNGIIADELINKLAYGVHSYFQFSQVGATFAEWNASFGTFAQTHPMVVSEWNQNATLVGGVVPKWCEPKPAGLGAPLNAPLKLLNYVKAIGVNGVVGWAFDMPNTINTEYGYGPTTTMVGAVCNVVPGGIGVWLQDYFAGTLP